MASDTRSFVPGPKTIIDAIIVGIISFENGYIVDDTASPDKVPWFKIGVEPNDLPGVSVRIVTQLGKYWFPVYTTDAYKFHTQRPIVRYSRHKPSRYGMEHALLSLPPDSPYNKRNHPCPLKLTEGDREFLKSKVIEYLSYRAGQ